MSRHLYTTNLTQTTQSTWDASYVYPLGQSTRDTNCSSHHQIAVLWFVVITSRTPSQILTEKSRVLDGFHFICLAHYHYYITVTHFGDYFAILQPVWSLCVSRGFLKSFCKVTYLQQTELLIAVSLNGSRRRLFVDEMIYSGNRWSISTTVRFISHMRIPNHTLTSRADSPF